MDDAKIAHDIAREAAPDSVWAIAAMIMLNSPPHIADGDERKTDSS